MQKTGFPYFILFLLLSFACKNEKSSENVIAGGFLITAGGPKIDAGNALAITQNNKTYCLGTTASFGNGGNDFYLVKISDKGKEELSTTFGSTGDETGYAVAVINGNELILAGNSTSGGGGGSDMFIVKCTTDGQEIFQKYAGTTYDDVALSVISCGTNGYLVGGYTLNPLTDKDFFLLRMDNDGNELWRKTYGGPAEDFIHSLYFSSISGDFYAFGNTRSYGAGDMDFYLIKLNSSGDSLWAKTYGTSEYEQAGSIMGIDSDLYLCGHTAGFGHPEHNAYLVKTDLNGTLAWEKNYGGMMHDGLEQGIVSNDGHHLVMTGYSSSYGQGDVDILYLKTDREGNQEEIRGIGNASKNIAFGILDFGNGFLMAGQQYDSANLTSDMVLVKVLK